MIFTLKNDMIVTLIMVLKNWTAKIIDNGDVWIEALDSRNKMSHTYNYKDFKKIIISIEKYYYPELEVFYLKRT